MSATQVSRSRVAMASARERTRGWLNAVNLHWAGVAVLSLVIVYLLVQMGLAWKVAKGEDATALAQQRTQLRMAEIAAKPLQGLDVKLADSSTQADEFYEERLPINYSEIASQLGVLKTQAKVRLNSVKYSQGTAATEPGGAKPASAPVPDSAGGKLTEVHLDASLTGDYRPLVLFINSLERDKVFFLINGVVLTGQQSGTVSLRLRMTTYLRGTVAEDEAEKANAAIAAPVSDLDKAVEVQAARAQKAGAR